jgi:hypothetical protein
MDIVEEVKREFVETQNIDQIRSKLLNRGFLENDVDEAIAQASNQILSQKKSSGSKGANRVITKSFIDKVGLGIGSRQYLNILFQQVGASLFLVGIINGLKSLLSVLISGFTGEYTKKEEITGRHLMYSELIIGLSFVMLILSCFYNSVWMFGAGLIVFGISFTFYNDMFNKVFKKAIEENKKDYLLGKITHYGLVLTGVCLLIGAFILDKYSQKSLTIAFDIFDKMVSLDLYGYMILLGLAALSFLIACFILPSNKKNDDAPKEKMSSIFKTYISYIPVLLKNKVILVLIATGTITGLVQTLGNSYYGIFIFNNFNHIGFGGYMNVAIIFVIALLTSIVAPYLTRINAIEYGKFPMLVFGTLLTAIMPLSYYYKPNLVSIAMGTVLGVIGGAITGVAQGLLTLEIIPESEKKRYFDTVGLLVTLPFLLTIPLGAYIAQVFGLKTLFLILALMLICVVVPLYFLIVMRYNKKEKI